MSRPFIRAASLEDVDSVLCLLTEAHRQGEFAFGGFSPDRVRQAITDCIGSGAVLLSLSHGVPVATLGLHLTGVWWCDDPVLQEFWVFVHPQHRRAPHARSMLRTARDFAEAAKVPLVIGVLSTTRTAGKVRLFQQEFGAPAGASFLVGA